MTILTSGVIACEATPICPAGSEMTITANADLVCVTSTPSVPQLTPAATGGVLGATTSLPKPKAKPAPAHGVLGTVTQVAGGTLPFTGLQIWVAVLAALALIALGVGVRRASTNRA